MAVDCAISTARCDGGRPGDRRSRSGASTPTVAAERLIEGLRDQQALACFGPCAERGAQQGPRLEQGGVKRCRDRGRKRGGAAGAHPRSSASSTKRRVSSIQVAFGTMPGGRNSSQGPRAASAAALRRAPRGSRRRQHTAAGAIRDRGGRVARTGVGNDHLAHDAGRRARQPARPASAAARVRCHAWRSPR